MWIFDDASALEVGWTLFNSFGALLVSWLCHDVWRDSRNRVLMNDDARRKATHLCIGITVVFVVAMLTYSVIGLVAMTQPPAAGAKSSPTSIAAFTGFMLVATIKITLCGYWRLLRFRLREDGVDPHVAIGKARAT
jgi:protein-S-isoprenylcysteine O-methyltransferase Ste14